MTSLKKIEGVKWFFFDLDGTLANSVSALFDLYRNFIKDFDILHDEADFLQLNGFSLREIVSFAKARYNLSPPVEDLVELYRNKLVRAYESEVFPIEGATLVLNSLHKKYKLQLVTSGATPEAMSFIRKQGWEKFFTEFTCGDEVTKGKPDPEIYLLALKKAGCSPDEVVVVEDSPNGIKAATSARLKTIGFTSSAKEEKLLNAGAMMTIDSLSEIQEVVGKDFEIINIGNVSVQCKEFTTDFTSKLGTKTLDFIEATWQQAVEERKGKLFDGRLFNLISLTKEGDKVIVEGGFINYRYFWVQKTTGVDLKIKALGVSGILLIDDEQGQQVAFARRTAMNLQYPGYFELIPSGGIDYRGSYGEIDYYQNLKNELYEEVGIGPNLIDSISTLGLIFDPHDKVYDIVCVIHTRLDKAALEKQMKNSGEYEELLLIGLEDIQRFISENRGSIVPVSEGILQMFSEIKID